MKLNVLFHLLFVLAVFCLIPGCKRSQSAEELKPFRDMAQIVSALNEEYRLGSSYYPEWWAPGRWEEDFRMMADLGLNTVRMGEFAWAAFEPEEGNYNFAWMDSVIALAARYGIKTILCTPTAAMPPWMPEKYPDVMTGNEYHQFVYSTRRCYSVENPDFLRLTERIVTEMGKHFSLNPNVIGWQIDNEPGSPIVSKDKYMQQGFREWLKDKYKTPDSLNKVWVGQFWSMNYTRWEQIHIQPESTVGFESHGHPGQLLEYHRFFSDSYVKYIALQSEILKKYAGQQFITTNFPNMNDWSINSFDANRHLDIAAWDNYAQDPGVTGYHEQFHSSMNHDHARKSSSTGAFIIAEQSTKAAPHAMQEKVRLQTYINIAHGASGNIFFQWRAPLGGGEMGYPSILELDGSYNKAEMQFRRLGQEIPRIWDELKNTRTEAPLAILFSHDNKWANGQLRKSSFTKYEWEVARYYRGLKHLKQNFDVINGGDLSEYKLIVAPNLELVNDEMAAKLEEFVRQGGILVLNKGAGTRDEFNRYREMIAPGVFAEMAGIKITGKMDVRNAKRYPSMQPGETFTIRFMGNNIEPLSVMEWVELNGARAIATFNGGRYEGQPAITHNKYHKGHVIYVATDCKEYALYDLLGDFIKKEFDIRPMIEAPVDVEVVSRVNDVAEYIFLLNISENSYEIPLHDKYQNLLTDQENQNEIVLEPLDVAILKKDLKP